MISFCRLQSYNIPPHPSYIPTVVFLTNIMESEDCNFVYFGKKSSYKQLIGIFFVSLYQKYYINMKKLLSLLLGILGFASCCNAQQDSIKTVSATKFAQIIQADTVVVVDVRTTEEYNVGHIEGARNIDVLKDSFQAEAVAALPKDKTVAVYCRSGKRSLKAAGILAKAGYHVINLRGGWLEWTEAKH